MKATTWGEISTLRYGKALTGYQSNASGAVQVFGTNGPIGFTDVAQGPGPAVIVGRKGAYRGVHYSTGPFWAIDTAYYVEHGDELDSRWCYYALKNTDINALGSGSAIPSTSREDFAAVPVRVPSLEDQRSIADLLAALDDKIAANSTLIAVTGDALEATFTWICGQSDETVPFTELATITKGVSYRSADLRPSSTALVTLKSFDRNGGYSLRGLKDYSGAHKPTQVIAPGELVVALTDLTQAAEVVGRAVRVPRAPRYQTLVASLDLAIIRPQTDVPVEFVLGVMLQGRFRAHCRSRTSGTTVLHLASDAMPTFQAPAVSPETQEYFAASARPLLELRDSLEYEIETLAATRDVLLPGLMSGKLRVKDAEKVLDVVGV